MCPIHPQFTPIQGIPGKRWNWSVCGMKRNASSAVCTIEIFTWRHTQTSVNKIRTIGLAEGPQEKTGENERKDL